MKYYIIEITPPIVGTDTELKFQAENEKVANDIAYMKTVEWYESYGLEKEEYEGESGIELEYDYAVREVSRQEYDQSDANIS